MSNNTPIIRHRERLRPGSSPGVAQLSPTQTEATASTMKAAQEAVPDAHEGSAQMPAPATLLRSVPVPASADGRTTPSYEVGYGKPPKASQFQPGRSGNPRGRPKHAKNTRTIVTELLDQIINVTAQGRSRKMSVREAGLHQIGKRAVEKADIKSLAFLLSIEEGSSGLPSSAKRTGPASNADGTDFANGLSVQELEILAFAHRERLQDAGLNEDQIRTVLGSLGMASIVTDADILPSPSTTGGVAHPLADA